MPILMRRVRMAIALAMLSGADNTERCGSKCSSASHITSRPSRFGGVDLLERLGKSVGVGAARQ